MAEPKQEPDEEKPVEEAKATKIVEAKAATAKTVSVTFDGVVDTTSATAIKLERGTTPITVATKYADDAKSVLLTSDTSLAAGTYTVTVGSLESVSFNVTKQTPTSLNIVNTTIANQASARVYFQVLDQYGEVMENYTDKKLTISAYNVTKGHAIAKGTVTKKDYFLLNCSTETVAAGGSFLNAIGDKISIVAYLTDNAAVACTTELEIVRVYTDELTLDDVKLGDDKRVTVNKTYEISYTAKDTEGKDVTFDEQPAGSNANGSASTSATVTIDNYNFISSNISAIDMTKVYVDSNGHLNFVAEGTPGTAVITAINTITGKTTSITIVVNNTAKLSSMDIADASVACNATPGTTKFKATVTAYDQFGEVIDAKNVKNVTFNANGTGTHSDNYFNSITATPSNMIQLNKITSDGKYVEYQVISDISGLKDHSVTFNFVSKEMGENGYIKSTSLISVDDRIEASALEIVKDPDATVSENGKVSVLFAVKDQYQNKMRLAIAGDLKTASYTDATTSDTYIVSCENTNTVVTTCAIKTTTDTNVYKMELTAPMIGDLSKSGTFTMKLKDGGKVIASKMYNLIVVDSIDSYNVSTDTDKYKAGQTIKVTVDAYSDGKFNPNYNATVDVDITANNSKTFSKTIKFENGIATFDLTAGTAGTNYTVSVAAKNANAEGTYASDTSDSYTVEGSEAGKLAVKADGYLHILDSQGNPTTAASARDSYATFKVMDENLNADITWDVSINGWSLKSDATLPVHITGANKVDKINNASYDLASGLTISNIPATSDNHNIVLSITIDGFTWQKKVAYTTGGSKVFGDTGAAKDAALAKAEENAEADFAVVSGAVFGVTGNASKVSKTFNVASGSTISVTTSAIAVDASGVTTGSGISASNVTSSDEIGLNVTASGAGWITAKYEVAVVGTATVNGETKTFTKSETITVKHTWDGSSTWTTEVVTTP